MRSWLFCIVAFSMSYLAAAQVDSTTPPFKKFPVLPPFQILLSDSTTLYKKENVPEKTPVLFMVFSPDCSHCQHEAEELTVHKNELKNVQIVLVTMHPLWMMKEFISTYKLSELSNVMVGKDIYYITSSFYN